ncbi:MAG TPA: HD domain-containing phosphohydrolase [Chloroflexota bacterium]|jgi:HD-GYP domain-containing protein (c-di-GMP phosphodiesterase class II)
MEQCTIDVLPVGARLAEPVRDESGHLVLQPGTIIHPSQREILKRMGVASVLVHDLTRPAATAPTLAETDEAVYRRIDEIRVGSVVMRPVLARGGRTLLQVGTRLNERYAEALERHGIEGIWVREPAARVEAAGPLLAEGQAEGAWPADGPAEPVGGTERRPDAETASIDVGSWIGSFRLERVALALAAAHETLAGVPEETAMLNSAVLFDAGTAVVGEVKASWRRPFMVEKITADQPYHLLHPIRSALLAVRLGTGLGLRDADLVRLGTAAVLMDIGMALLPGSLVGCPGELDAEARALMQRHPEMGAQLLRRSGYEESLSQIVLEHHEGWAGDGYPQQKSGNGIYRSARLLNLAMSYVALSSDRPYRPAYLPHEAVEFLLAFAGDQFDPGFVDTLLRTVPPYPAGARVLLDGDVPATVVDAQIGQLARPIVRLDDGAVVDMAAPGHLNRFVVGVVSAPAADDAPARGGGAPR